MYRTNRQTRRLTFAHLVIKRLFVEPMECFKRDDFTVLAEIEGIDGLREKSIGAIPNGTYSESEYVVFFTSDDCDTNNVIDNAWLAGSPLGGTRCSSHLPNQPHDYQSWSVWDMCGGEPDCTLE
jgi:hypothetical protein